jgi:hypothetical protein
MSADTNGNAEHHPGAPGATDAERQAIRDPDSKTGVPHAGGRMICMEIGCWEPANETWEEFLARKRAPQTGEAGGA